MLIGKKQMTFKTDDYIKFENPNYIRVINRRDNLQYKNYTHISYDIYSIYSTLPNQIENVLHNNAQIFNNQVQI